MPSGKKVDWWALKQDFACDPLATPHSIAKKYGLNYKTVSDHAMKEQWVEERKRKLDATISRAVKKTAISEGDRYAKILNAADLIADKIERTAKMMSESNEVPQARLLRELTGALKDIKDIQSLKSDRDIREQEARIKAMEAQSKDPSSDLGRIIVQFGGSDSEELSG